MASMNEAIWSAGLEALNHAPPMSRTAARSLADRLERDGPDIRSSSELRLILAALRYYGE